MTKKEDKPMRIKEVGATINLGNFSSVRVVVGEETEYAGLELQRATNYLRGLAEKMGGVLNLPEDMAQPKKKETVEERLQKIAKLEGNMQYAYGNGLPISYEHATHCYTNDVGVPVMSVTQFLELFYPFNDSGAIKQEYLDYAANFGNLIHTAIQNAVIGMPAKKGLTKQIIDDVLKEMGDFGEANVERIVYSPEMNLAGRFDIFTKGEKNVLWDVKTNSDLFATTPNCKLPNELCNTISQLFNPRTIFGEHCLQLNLYATILEEAGEKVDEIKIIHVPDNFEQIYDVPRIDTKTFVEEALEAIS